MQAPNFLISPACFLCSGFRGPFLLPTRFSVSAFSGGGRFVAGLVARQLGFFLDCRLPWGEILPVEVGELCGDDDVFILIGLCTGGVIDGKVGRGWFSCLMSGDTEP